jgi:hypothetical protein
MPNLAIVRDFSGRPLCRAVVGAGNGVIFICSERSISSNNEGFPPPIGVPCNDAFDYDATRYEAMLNKWKAGKKIEPSEWGRVLQAPAK